MLWSRRELIQHVNTLRNIIKQTISLNHQVFIFIHVLSSRLPWCHSFADTYVSCMVTVGLFELFCVQIIKILNHNNTECSDLRHTIFAFNLSSGKKKNTDICLSDILLASEPDLEGRQCMLRHDEAIFQYFIKQFFQFSFFCVTF